MSSGHWHVEWRSHFFNGFMRGLICGNIDSRVSEKAGGVLKIGATKIRDGRDEREKLILNGKQRKKKQKTGRNLSLASQYTPREKLKSEKVSRERCCVCRVINHPLKCIWTEL